MHELLTSLKEVPGVVGSFVLNPAGTLIARDMPAYFPDSVFPELAQHLGSFNGTLDALMPPSRELVLKFESHWLFTWRSAQGFLCVLSLESINQPALRLAVNGALKQVVEYLAGRTVTPRITPIPEWPEAERLMA